VASLQSFRRGQEDWLRFAVRPDPTRADIVVSAARLKSKTRNGERLHIETLLAIGERTYPLEIILTDASAADFALIIGRSGIKRDDVIDPNRSYLLHGR
jgi:ribosomal protein S6--L-glutamate ligase